LNGRIFVEIERCMACRRCVLACAVEHSASKELYAACAEVPAPRARVGVGDVNGAAVPTSCRHCDAAACVAACPTGALERREADGPVLLREARCVGCASCVVACPYGVVRQHRDRREVTKCDLCVERLAGGRAPACVEACPTRTLTFRGALEPDSWLKRALASAPTPTVRQE
jgi:carbon-monoxide dehydrogenase iron sulfur subunit